MARLLDTLILAFVLGFASFAIVQANDNGDYEVGVGIADVTGPAADIGMMGYASLTQKAAGIHTRLYSRAFIFKSGSEMATFVSADIGMVDQAIKIKVIERLQEKYGMLFTTANVILSGTHTHSGPGAYLQYLMYGITSSGFLKSSFYAIVDGMVQSIERAYAKLQPGRLFIDKGILLEANANRSPSSYLANPEDERAEYEHDVDKEMVLLRIQTPDGSPLGSINWFPVHPTSMNNTNTLLSGDNKGYASQLFESEMNPGALAGKGDFVAAFASSNLGDVSPNIKEAICVSGPDQGSPCDYETSTCNCGPIIGNCTQPCIAFGPGETMEESCEIIGRRQYEAASKLYKNEAGTAEQLKGNVQSIHQFLDMNWAEWDIIDPITGKTPVTTCPGALGISFGAGTTDGPGLFDFTQGSNSSSDFWNLIVNALQPPTWQQLDCQRPKPILLNVGEANYPYAWIPNIVETQILRVGNLYMVAIPGELTTMSGRRLRKAIETVVRTAQPNGPTPHVVIAGLSNVYTHYIATYEEYRKQRYEAASTLYGPHTLGAYMIQYSNLAEAMLTGANLDAGPSPPNLLHRQWSLIAPVAVDTVPLLKTFGDVLVEPVPEVNPGETVVTQFVGGHPRNDPMREGTFLIVEMDVGTSRWKTVATDADWSTKMRWIRPKFLSTDSVIEISWKVPANAEAGYYRIRHFGHYKPVTGTPAPYQGMTAIFRVNGPGIANMNHPEWSPELKKPTQIREPREFWRALTKAIKL